MAAWILEEIASEKRWDEAFAASSGALSRLAEEALQEYRAGKTQPLDLGEVMSPTERGSSGRFVPNYAERQTQQGFVA